jgi:hypothetical protein
MTAAELAATSTQSMGSFVRPEAQYFPVPSDSSQRIGDNIGIEGATLEHLFDESSPARTSDGTPAAIPCSEAQFFGIEQHARPASVCAQNVHDKTRWSPYPPFRFSVEFWDVEALKEKSRLHSRTIWYAGSLWNVYVQVVRKKVIQLGVYLHRQSSVDPIPAASAPVMLPSASNILQREPSQPAGVPLHQAISSPSVQYPTPSVSRAATPRSNTATPVLSSSLPSSYSQSGLSSSSSHSSIVIPAMTPPIAPAQPYRDPRSAVSAYFTVACAGSTGSSITRFSSSPDVFSVSQSWGWKTSSLMTGELSEPGELTAAGKDVSLRATVMLGIV